MTPQVWRDRITGCLLGGALGDAVGAPFEGSFAVAADRLQRWLSAREPLRWTDDTALQVATAGYLARLAQPDDFHDDQHARALAEAWADDPDRGYGPAPPGIFRVVLAGDDWRAVAGAAYGGAGSLGNGAAMRAAPIGAVTTPSDALAVLARRAGAATHTHPVGTDGAVVIAVAASFALRSEAPHAPTLLQTCRMYAATEPMQRALDIVPDAVAAPDPTAAALITGNGITASEAVAAALTAFLRRPADPVAAIREAVLMGGDTDTVAAMAGSLAGAACGAERLPQQLLDRLEDRARLAEVADALAGRSWSWEAGR